MWIALSGLRPLQSATGAKNACTGSTGTAHRTCVKEHNAHTHCQPAYAASREVCKRACLLRAASNVAPSSRASAVAARYRLAVCIVSALLHHSVTRTTLCFIAAELRTQCTASRRYSYPPALSGKTAKSRNEGAKQLCKGEVFTLNQYHMH